ncbi:alpha/beta hydrolase [uncultured Tenacibaculum sp.]|uniref:alpha/beta hydrolase n=1 Tax=uncultured Tenacibaculum sp. TaxID=174713 RepID=UPI00263302E2|nr:alpha/beta hydrolase [uncultured Tenacibaculum sp.]
MRYIILFCIVFLPYNILAQAKLAGSNGLDPTVQQFLEVIHSYNGPPIHELPIDIARKAMEDMQIDSTISYSKLTFEKQSLEFKNQKINVVITKPKGSKKLIPVLMYFHGGGWAYNSFETHKRLMSDIANKAEIAVVFVEYSRTPKIKYPVANEEAYLATLYVSKFGEKLGLNSKKIIVGGDSAGGNMATVVALMAKKRKEFKLRGQVLLYPVTDTNLNTASYHQFSKGYYLSRKTMQWFFEIYTPDVKNHNLSTVAPLKAIIEELKELPKTLLITAEYDVLRDEGEAYAKKLRIANVPVISTRYGGTIHDFIVLNALRNTPASKAALEQISNFLITTFSNQ